MKQLIRVSIALLAFMSGSLLFAKQEEAPVFLNEKSDEIPAVVEVKRPPLKKMPLVWELGDSKFELRSKYRNDIFTWGKNLSLLNSCNPNDKYIVPGKHTFDMSFIYHYGLASRGYDVLKVVGTLRNRYVFGDAEASAATARTSIKDLEVVFGEHSHPLTLLLPIIRELWMEMTLNDVVGFASNYRQTFTFGVFPFQLGRGISLGDAYAVVPDLLGYNPANAVQQYAPGFKFSGALMEDEELTYDAYVEIVDNRSDSFDNVNLRLLGQQYGRRFNPARGFGKLNYILAGRFIWTPWDQQGKKLSLEPYGLYNNEREQRIEFLGDASSKLGTVGLALEAEYGNFEWGFDTAFNFGHQCVYGWDRNIITKELRNGLPYYVNSKVVATVDGQPNVNDVAKKKVVYVPGSDAQNAIETGAQAQDLNNQLIDGTTMKNAADRFSDPYKNKYKGKMFVLDAAYWFSRPQIKWAWAVGMATGDVPPNRDLEEINDSSIDGDYKGFIGLQEIYAGTRVRSALLLSGASRIPRVSAFPAPTYPGDKSATVVTRFTNIAFGGTALWMDYTVCGRNFKINPNILVYGQEHATRIFDRLAGDFAKGRFASKFFGTELNAFLEAMLMPDLKLFAVMAVFIPGTHFYDIQGLPITPDQVRALDEFDRTGFLREKVPFLGDSPAYYLNMGFEYKF